MTTPVILAILPGQSNINGRNTDDGLTTTLTDVYQYGGASAVPATYQTLTTDIVLLDHPENLVRTGPDEQILADLHALYPTHKIVGVPCAEGSTALVGGTTPAWASSATPGSGGVRFEFMVNQANAARAAVIATWPDADIETMFYFVQGEQDAVSAVSKATYETALTNFISHSRSRITGASNAKFIIGSMLPQKWIIGSANYDAAYAAINAAHVAVSVAGTDVFYVMGPDNRAANDNLHYQPASVARQFGTAMVNVLSDVTGPTMTSPNTYANITGSTLAHLLTSNDTHATFHIDGGADAAQFEISDQYLTPTLRWTGNGTGPGAGSYVVGVRARDGKGNYGTTQTITLTVAAEVSPASFFTAGERGMVWNPNDISTLFQNIAGTTPVTAAGQPVGRMLDLSGNNNHWVAAADNTTRPTYLVDSDGKGYLSFDGSNDVMFAGTPFVTPGSNIRHSACVGLFGSSQASERDVLGCYSTSTTTPFVEPFAFKTSAAVTYSMRNDASGGFSPAAGTVASILDNTTKKVVSAHFNGTNSTMRQRDAAQRPAGGGSGYSSPGGWSNTIGTVGSAFTVTRASLGARGFNTPNGFFNGRIYAGFVINRFLTDADIKAGEEWVANRTITTALPGQSSGLTPIEGSAGVTLAALTTASAAAIAIKATGVPTFAALTTTSAAATALKGTAGVTLAALTTTSAAGVTLKGAANDALAPLTTTSAAAIAVKGSANKTLAPLTVIASGGAESLPNTGAINATLAALTSGSASKLAIAAALVHGLAPLTSGSASTLAIAASLVRTLSPLTGVGTGRVLIQSAAGVTLQPLTAFVRGIEFDWDNVALSAVVAAATRDLNDVAVPSRAFTVGVAQ